MAAVPERVLSPHNTLWGYPKDDEYASFHRMNGAALRAVRFTQGSSSRTVTVVQRNGLATTSPFAAQPDFMPRRRYFFSSFADVCLAGDWQPAALSERIVVALGDEAPWIKPFAQRVRRHFSVAPTHAELVEFLGNDMRLARIRQQFQPRIRHFSLTPPAQLPLHPAVPQLSSPGELAQWLGVSIADLDWFADRSNYASASALEKIRHYHIATLAKRDGGVRLIEAPKPTLKDIQRRIHDDMLQHLPLHPAAFGFVAERGALQHAALHVGQPMVLRFDLSDCFLHVHGGHVYRAFRALGYGEALCRDLLGLCTHRVPRTVLQRLELSARQQELAQQNHLPQGAPSSPLLSHFALAGIDRRLAGYARKLNAHYSRYADDLVLSGGMHLQRQFRQIEQRVGAIVREEGFCLNHRKSRCMAASQRQQVTGICVNQQLNLPRREFDRLKAELHNNVQQGWRSQHHAEVTDYRAHLRGRIEWCRQLNPARAEKLQRLFERIDWSQ